MNILFLSSWREFEDVAGSEQEDYVISLLIVLSNLVLPRSPEINDAELAERPGS